MLLLCKRVYVSCLLERLFSFFVGLVVPVELVCEPLSGLLKLVSIPRVSPSCSQLEVILLPPRYELLSYSPRWIC
jgi:hypothetical protein